MGHNASLQIFGKEEKATKHDDAVSPEKFKKLESSIYVVDESKANHRSNAVAKKQARYLEESDLNGLSYEADDEEGTSKEEYEQKTAALEAEKQQLRKEIDRLTASSTSNLVRYKSLENEFKGRMKILEAEIQQLKDENHKLLTRLSEIGDVRLIENNRNIADICDANSPDKLAVQMSELYDNEWTDAFQHLTQTEGLQDEETVRRLLSILKTIYKICQKSTRKQTENLKKAILVYLGLSEENKDDIAVKETEKRLREYRSTELEPTLGCVIKDIKDQLKDELEGKVHDTLDKYIQKCTRLCWFMGIKNPQMYLDFYRSQRKGTPEDDANDFPSHFDTTKFLSYQKFGMYVEYIVWPALCLYKDGPIIRKGVAQGLNREPEVQKPNVQKNGDTSSNIDDKIVIDADQGQDGDNSESDIAENKDEDDDISQCLPYAGDAVYNTVSENTVQKPNVQKNGDTSSNIDDKIVIDADQGQDGDNSESDIAENKDEDNDISQCLPYAGDAVYNTVSENTVQKPNVLKNGDTSSNIDDKIVIDADQGQDGDNSESDIAENKDEDDDISQCLPYAGDAVYNPVSENTVQKPNVQKNGDTSSNIDDKIVIDADQGQDGDNSESDIAENKDEDNDISQCLPYADDGVYNTVSENTVQKPNVLKNGDTSSNIDDKIVIDADQGQDGDNSESIITENKDEDYDISQCLPYAGDAVYNTVSENTVHSNSPNFEGHDLSDGKQVDVSPNENTEAKISDDSCQDEGLSNATKASKEDESFRSQDESDTEELIFGNDDNTEKSAFAGSKGQEDEGVEERKVKLEIEGENE